MYSKQLITDCNYDVLGILSAKPDRGLSDYVRLKPQSLFAVITWDQLFLAAGNSRSNLPSSIPDNLNQ